ncbi:unnamed protein product [Amoebophrya sp. A120]|nr:unnamed protein product [Amoebophrya sp. A120]|eukprot:GSA120T00025518001.1
MKMLKGSVANAQSVQNSIEEAMAEYRLHDDNKDKSIKEIDEQETEIREKVITPRAREMAKRNLELQALQERQRELLAANQKDSMGRKTRVNTTENLSCNVWKQF